VLELIKEMEERLYPLLYRTLPPSVYHVYLHPDDHREIEAIVPLIVADAEQGLSARVDELNARGLLSTMIAGKRAPIEVPVAGWEIHLHAEPNGELTRGELGIESRLSVPPPPRYVGGTPTTRIARTVVTGAIRRGVAAPSVAEAPASWAPANGALVPSPGALTASPALTDAPGVSTQTDRSAAPAASGVTGRLAYVDDSGAHVFVMRKDLISIGRGGSAHWVDVQVVTTARVSREHCRIRRTADGRFFLQDVSTWGTSVDGRPVTPFARQINGSIEQTGDEHELKGRARIQLADAVAIDFMVEQ
jgi:pSer/pThr/pTyr-binding forkhead associated (FHA) protein